MAVTATSIWEIRSTGNDANGGGFDPTVTSPGTDYSQQTSPQVTFNGTTITATTSGASATIIITGYTVVSTDNGNLLQITAGTNYTAGFYTIISVDTGLNTWTLNANVTTGVGTGMVAKMGGAVATMTKPVVVAGNVVYVKATATYSVSASQTFSVSGSAGLPIVYIGYTSTRGDNGFVTIQPSGNNLTLFIISGTFRRFFNFIADCNTTTTSKGFTISNGHVYLSNCKVINFTTTGFSLTSNRSQLINCYATVGGSGATAAFSITGFGSDLIGCVAAGNSCPGFLVNSASTSSMSVFTACIAANNTGASSDGFRCANTSQISLKNCIAYSNGRDGVLLDTTTSATAGDDALILNCILVSNAGYGINSNTTNYTQAASVFMDYNAFYNNTLGLRNNVITGTNDITLTADPFINGSGLNFAINKNQGAGLSCIGSGFPGILQAGGTGYLDRGSLQHLDSPYVINAISNIYIDSGI